MSTRQMEVFLTKSINSGYEHISDTNLAEGCFSEEYILIGKGTATIEIDDSDVTEKVVACLNRQKQKLIADHVVEIEKLDEKIQSLLAIGHDGE